MIVAAAQIAPILFDRDQSLQKVNEAITAAAKEGAKLVAFGESLVPAYPFWTTHTDGAKFESDLQKLLHAKLLDQAIVTSPQDPGHLAETCKTAEQNQIAVYLGIAERAGHTIYCSLVYIDPTGQIKSVHRKLMPTYEERLSWGIGDGHGLVTHPLEDFRVGGLNCWENWMPLARTALYQQGENLHVMAWPGCERLTQDITRYVARESRSFVISASAIIRKEDIPTDLPGYDQLPDQEVFYDGGSAICFPTGDWVVPPVINQEGLIYADIDIQTVYQERQNFDPTGHYSRPDVLTLSWTPTRQH